MLNYKELYYQSQAALANALETLEKVTNDLRWLIQSSEEAVIDDEEEETE